MDEKKENAQLSDEELSEVTGGHDDYDACEWSPTGSHSWVFNSSLGCWVCEHCEIRKY